MNVLMTIAVVGATAIGQAEEAATVVFLFAFGGWLEARALSRTRSSISELMTLAPPAATDPGARFRVRASQGAPLPGAGELAPGGGANAEPGDAIAGERRRSWRKA